MGELTAPVLASPRGSHRPGATAAHVGARTDPGLPWRRAFALGVLGFAAYAAVTAYLERLEADPHTHQVGDWLISYPGEFVRRGLFGELLFAVAPRGTGALWLLFAVQLALCVPVVAYALRFLHRQDWSWSAIALAAAPAGIAFAGWDPSGAFRKETIAFAALALLGFARHRPAGTGRAMLRSAALALWVLGVFSWEPTALMLPAVVWLLVPGTWTRAGLWWTAAFGAVSATGLLLSVAHRGDDGAADGMCQAVLDQGLAPRLCDGAIAWMGLGAHESAESLAELVPVNAAYLLLLPLAALPIAFSPWLRANWRWTAIIAVATAPLFALGIDYGRWVHILFMQIAICMMLAPKPMIRSRQWTALATVLYVTTWGLPHAWSHPDAAGWPFRGMLASAIDLVQTTLLGWW